MDNDAKSCYDRIICTLAMIISQYFGLSATTTKMQAKTLKKMQFRLRTALGDSTKSYQHSDETPIHGTGQGSCASPALWLLISSILMDCISDLGGGMTMQDVVKTNIIQQWIDGFVDDTSLFVNLKDGIDKNDVNALHVQLSNDMILWQELLEASGGMLELSKCFYYVMSWKFDAEGFASPLTKTEQRSSCEQICIYNTASQSYTKIVQKEVSESHKTLGCFKSIDGNEVEQKKKLKDKSDKYGNRIQSSKLSRKCSLMSYKMIYIPSLKYGLPSCSLSKEDIDLIQGYAVDKFVSKIGFEHTMPRAVIFGPQEYGGIELPHLYTEMMGAKLETMISHMRADTKLGKAFMININYLQLTAGIEEPIFESKQDLDFIDINWLSHLRDYMIQINATFQFQHAWKIKKQRENDIILMDSILSRGLTKKEKRLVNNWRIFFQVNTLVDICDPTGKKIEKCFLKRPEGKSIDKSHQSILNWPIQNEPGKKGFAIWLKCLKECFNMQSNGCINHRFGKWLPENYHSQNKCKSYYQPSSQHAFIQDRDSLVYYTSIATRSASITCNSQMAIPIASIPNDCVPAESSSKNGIIIFKFSKLTSILIQSTQRMDLIEEPITWKDPIIEHLDVVNDELISQNRLQQIDKFDIITDGGVHELKGIFGVVITDGTTPLVTNKGKIYSVDYLESPYRSEMYGILSGIVTFQELMKDIIQPEKVLVCIHSDNKPAIKRIRDRRNRRRTVNQYRDSDVDVELQLLHEITCLEKNNYDIVIKYVKGHQDRKKAKSELPHIELMNTLADQLTNDARSLKNQLVYIPFPTNNVNLTLNNSYINSKYRSVTKKAYHSMDLRQYLQKRYTWSDGTIESIWWKVYYKSFEKLSNPDQTRVQKFIHDKLPTNKRDHQKYDFKQPNCKECLPHEVEEDEDHIIQCPSAKRETLRKDWLSEIKGFLANKHTPENVSNAIYNGLKSWLEASEVIDDKDYGSADQAMRQQNTIGWRHFVRGRMAMDWAICVRDHIHQQGIKGTTYEQWGALLLAINWKYFLKIWKERNGKEHGVTIQEQEEITKQKTIAEIESIYSNNEASIYRSVVAFNIDDMKNMNSAQLVTYLYSLKIITKMYMLKHQKVPKKNMTTYFPAIATRIRANVGIAEGTDNSELTEGDSEVEKDKSELDPGEIR